MFCRACGSEIADDAVVCVRCGRATGVPVPGMIQPPAKDEGGGGTFIFAVIAALIIPIAGFVGAVVLLAKGKIGHGLAVGLLSLLSALMWLGVLASGG